MNAIALFQITARIFFISTMAAATLLIIQTLNVQAPFLGFVTVGFLLMFTARYRKA